MIMFLLVKTMSEHGKREIDTLKTISSIRKIRIDKVLKNDLLSLKNIMKKCIINLILIILYLVVLNHCLLLLLIEEKLMLCKRLI